MKRRSLAAEVERATRTPARRLSALWTVDPSAAAREVAGALERAKNLRDAARTLGVGTMTLHRWVHDRPELASFRKGAA